MATDLAAEDLHEFLGLLLRGALVDEDPDPPVALRHDLGGIDDDGHLAPGKVSSIDRALPNAEDQSGTAEVYVAP